MYYNHFLFPPASLLNIHEDERVKPENWIPVGWLPIIDQTRSRRPGQGYTGAPARNTRLFHACWTEFLSNWEAVSRIYRIVVYSDGIARLTRHFIAGLLGDQQVWTVLNWIYVDCFTYTTYRSFFTYTTFANIYIYIIYNTCNTVVIFRRVINGQLNLLGPATVVLPLGQISLQHI